jgi:hypothetical protein
MPPMIDNPKQVADLLAKLEAALPLPAIVTPRLAATLRQRSPGTSIPKTCQVTWVSNAGDAGGIMCRLSPKGETDDKLALVPSVIDFAVNLRIDGSATTEMLRDRETNCREKVCGEAQRGRAGGSIR